MCVFAGFRRGKASVTVVALVAVTLLFLLSMVITSMVQMGFLQTQRMAQKTQARWLLEGEVAKWFVFFKRGEVGREGKIPLTLSNSTITGELTWSLGITNWRLDGWAGGGIGKSELHLEGWRVPLFPATVSWLFPVNVSLRWPWEIEGDIALPPGSTFETNSYALHLTGKVIVQEIEKSGFFGKNSVVSMPLLWEKRQDLAPLFELAKREVKDPWRITTEGSWFIQEVVNYLSLKKQWLAWGGSEVVLPFSWTGKQNLYIRKKVSTNGLWENYLYYKGPQKMETLSIDGENRLSLLLSRNPYLREKAPVVELPSEAWDTLGEIVLRGKDVSLLSQDEDVLAFSLGEREYYFAESDFVYDGKRGVLKLTSGEFFRRHVGDVAVADGWSREFWMPAARGNVIVYIDGKRVWNYQRTATKIIFERPPVSGSKIQLARGLENFTLYKIPPGFEEGLFSEPVERSVVLDLDDMYNLPENGVIYSTLPLIVRGTAKHKLCIVSEGSIYLEDINPEGGEPVALVSKSGVWLLQEDGGSKVLRGVAIISPLAGLYTLGENFVPAFIEGVGLFAAFGPSPAISGYMEHHFKTWSFPTEDFPILSRLPSPIGVKRLWRR
ncbi:hypothetical protein [Thermospira aquatica]|uniref:Caspase family p10 domain-containing protein n=1 Tax=Thermospira aquatica TaxID=2828656 RepID=A0AAX3BF39_9SPIR|nr:hypothetical protein [Thermospira aquatica]URA10689.1 hypothetical protein KDW03_02485 [Thermospira aquatica]